MNGWITCSLQNVCKRIFQHLFPSLQVSFPPSGFLSPEKLDQLAKLLPESEEEPMDATEDYEEVRKKGSLENTTSPLVEENIIWYQLELGK